MADCGQEAVRKGREIAKNIVAKLDTPVNECVQKFLVQICHLVEAYTEYIWSQQKTTPNDPIRRFIELKVTRVDPPREMKKDFIQKMLLDHLMPNERSSDHTGTDHSQKPGGCGQVQRSFENLMTVVREGNIRERLTLIYNFRFSCALMWDVIKIYYVDHKAWLDTFGKILDIGNFEGMLQLMSKKLEMPMADAVHVCQTWLTHSESKSVPEESKCMQSSPSTTLSLCALVYLPVSGQVLGSRVCPEGACRAPPDSCNRLVPFEAVTPPLSPREIQFIDSFSIEKYIQSMAKYLGTHKIQSIKNGKAMIDNVAFVPWISGKVMCNPKEDSFFYQFYKRYNKPMVTGPSGTVDMFMTFARYFPLSLYEKQLILLGIIAWMGIPPDHSIFEMLSVVPAHGVVDYQHHESEYAYVESMIQHFATNPKTPFSNIGRAAPPCVAQEPIRMDRTNSAYNNNTGRIGNAFACPKQQGGRRHRKKPLL